MRHIFIIAFLVPVISGFVLFATDSQGIVVTTSGEILGVIEKAREKLQGRDFWNNQARLVEEEIRNIDNDIEKTHRTEERVIDTQQKLNEKILQHMESSGFSATALQAQVLRSQADVLDTLDTFESRRQYLLEKRLPELKNIQNIIQNKLRTG